MTETNEPERNPDGLPDELPNTPITARTLESVIIPKPAGGNTLCRFIMTDGEKYAKFEELTAEERETVLKFIMQYAAPLVVNRLPRRRPCVPDEQALLDLDPEPLNQLLEEIEAKRNRKQSETEKT
jgi:hypothetical protein